MRNVLCVCLLALCIPASADDTASLQRLFDDAKPGATIKLEAKTYEISGPISCRKAIHLDARGAVWKVKHPFAGVALTLGGPTGKCETSGTVDGLRIEQFPQWPLSWHVTNPKGTGLRIVNAKAWRFKGVEVYGFDVGVHWDCDQCYSTANSWEDGILGENRTTWLVTPRDGQSVNVNRVSGGAWYVGPWMEGPFTFFKLSPSQGTVTMIAGWSFTDVSVETTSPDQCTWAEVTARGCVWDRCEFEGRKPGGPKTRRPFVIAQNSMGNRVAGEFTDGVQWQDASGNATNVCGTGAGR